MQYSPSTNSAASTSRPPLKPAVEVSILIISYNTRQLTLECIASILSETHDLAYEIIVVDNASQDGSAEAIEAAYPEVRLFKLKENLGFARGNNYAASHAVGEFLLLLNPDTVILNGAIQRLVAFARDYPSAGIWGGRTVFPDGTLNPTSCWGKPTLWGLVCRCTGLGMLLKNTRWFDPEPMGWWRRDSIRQVATVTGCFLLIRSSLWRQLNGFDPRFTMYGEEVDLCLRARDRGFDPMFTPHATIVHYGGASERVKVEQVIRQFVARSKLLDKHWSPFGAWLGKRCLDLWAWNKMARLWVTKANTRDGDFPTWREIWRRRKEWHHVDTGTSTSTPISELAGSELAASGKA